MRYDPDGPLRIAAITESDELKLVHAMDEWRKHVMEEKSNAGS